jgi:hypothetical protein
MPTDSDSTSSNLGFKQLDDTNYSIWVQRMTDSLARKKYWRYAQGTVDKPHPDAIVLVDTDAGRLAHAKALKAFKKELNEWEDNDRAAAALIRSGISDSQLPHVQGSTTAHDMWTRICSAHEKQGLNHALSFLHVVVSTQCEESTKIQEHINTIRTAHERLMAADVAMHLPDQALAGILLYSFPSSYEPVKMTLSTLKKEDFTFAAVSRAMLNEEQRRITSGSLPTANGGIEPFSAAAVMTASGKQRMSCTWCGLDNHLEVNCHRKKNGISQRSAADRKQALDEFHQRRRNPPTSKSTVERDTAAIAYDSDDDYNASGFWRRGREVRDLSWTD